MQGCSRAGERAFREEQSAAALSLLKRAYLLSHGHPCGRQRYRCLFNLAAAYLQAAKPRKALQCLVRCQQERGGEREGDPDLLFNMGMANEGLGQTGDALSCYQVAVTLHGQRDPGGQADARVKGAYCQLALRQRGAAAHSFALAAQGYRQAGRGEDAAMALREAANHMIVRGKGLHTQVCGALSLLQDCLHLCRDVKDVSLRGTGLLHYTHTLCPLIPSP